MSIAEAQGYEGDAPSTIAEAVNALGSVMGGGGSGGADTGLLVVHFGEQDDSITADKSFNEIASAIDAGQIVFGTFYDEYYQLNQYQNSGEPGSIPFALFTRMYYNAGSSKLTINELKYSKPYVDSDLIEQHTYYVS